MIEYRLLGRSVAGPEVSVSFTTRHPDAARAYAMNLLPDVAAPRYASWSLWAIEGDATLLIDEYTVDFTPTVTRRAK